MATVVLATLNVDGAGEECTEYRASSVRGRDIGSLIGDPQFELNPTLTQSYFANCTTWLTPHGALVSIGRDRAKITLDFRATKFDDLAQGLERH